MRYIEFLKIMLNKEKIYYSRMFSLFKKVEGIGGKLIAYPICFILITFFHYCFALMHFLFESYLFLFNNKQFVINIKKELKLC